MTNATNFQNEIVEAARLDDDVRLAEAIQGYFSVAENVSYLPLRRIKSFFVAARSEDSEAWKELSEATMTATRNVLTWTGHSANTIAVVLRTYERATEELKQAQREGRISRYPAESISRLHGKPYKDLQAKLVELYIRNQISHEDLRNMVRELQRAIGRTEQDAVIGKYIPEQHNTVAVSRSVDVESLEDSILEDKIFIPHEISINDLRLYSDDELWKLKNSTEGAIERAIPLLERSLEQIKRELKRRL